MSLRITLFQHMPPLSGLTLAPLATLLLAAGITAAQPAPSFDCAKAAGEAEQAICKDGELAKLDAAIARAYEAAAGKLKGAGAKALREDQRSFLAIRDAAHGRPDDNLRDRLSERLTFLERVAASAGGKGFAGVWENSFGTIAIKPAEGGKLAIDAQAADPVSARWVCDIGDEVAPKGGALSFTDAAPDAGQEATATIRLRLEGPLLTVAEELKPGAIRAYCGANGALEGTYFRSGP